MLFFNSMAESNGSRNMNVGEMTIRGENLEVETRQ